MPTRSVKKKGMQAGILSRIEASGPPTGFTALIVANIQDVANNKLLAGTLLVQPTDGNNAPITAAAGGAGGPMIITPAQFPIVNGAIPTGSYVADTSLTKPPNISFRITVLDPNGFPLSTLKGVQPTGASFDLDTFEPHVPAQAIIQYGPPGPTGATGAPVGGVTLIDIVDGSHWNLTVASGASGIAPSGGTTYGTPAGALILIDTTTGSYWKFAIAAGAQVLTPM